MFCEAVIPAKRAAFVAPQRLDRPSGQRVQDHEQSHHLAGMAATGEISQQQPEHRNPASDA